MKKLLGYAFAIGAICLGSTSCSDDFEDYYRSDELGNISFGGAHYRFTDLWNCDKPDALNGMVLTVPKKGGKYTLDINPEATYIAEGDDGITRGPYNIPETLYPVPDYIVESGLGDHTYYTCSQVLNHNWDLAYFGPLESPYGKVYMEKNRLVIDMNKCGKGGRAMILNVSLCQEMEGAYANRLKGLSAYIKILQGK